MAPEGSSSVGISNGIAWVSDSKFPTTALLGKKLDTDTDRLTAYNSRLMTAEEIDLYENPPAVLDEFMLIQKVNELEGKLIDVTAELNILKATKESK